MVAAMVATAARMRAMVGVRLAEAVSRAYGLELPEIAPAAARGESALHYRAVDADGRRWFLKVVLPDRCYPRRPRRLDAALRLTGLLRERVGAADVVAPAPTRDGAPLVKYGAAWVVLFPFVEAGPLGARAAWPDAALAAVARMVGELQASTGALGRLAPWTERFELGYERLLARALDGLAAIGPDARPGQRAARDAILPRRRDTLRLVERHRELQSHARRRRPRLVLCHTDLNGDNLLRDAGGRVHAVDWDDLRLAPPEQDVRYILDAPRLGTALRAYEDAAGPTPLDPDVFGFYFHRRVLLDLAYFACRILSLGRSDAQDTHDLGIVRSDCFWAFDGGIDARIEALRARL
jgi:spectinomycin phosphotransferase